MFLHVLSETSHVAEIHSQFAYAFYVFNINIVARDVRIQEGISSH